MDLIKIQRDRTSDGSWKEIFLDAIVCTFLFAVCNLVGECIFTFVLRMDPKQSLTVIWLPVWCAFMLPVAIYAKLRGRFEFDYSDLAWYSPVMFVLGGSIDWFGTRSLFAQLIAYFTYVTIAAVRSQIARARSKEMV